MSTRIKNLRECQNWIKENRDLSVSDKQSPEFWDELFDVIETMAGFLDSAVASLESEGKLI